MKSKITPRDYQVEAAHAPINYWDSGGGGNPLIVAATAAGKSVIIALFIQKIMSYPKQRVLMSTHVKELIEQNYLKLLSFWPSAPVGIYSAGIGKKQPWCDIVCGGIQSMYKKAASLGHRDIIIIDEAHLLNAESEGMYIKLINDLKKINPYLKIVGYTATDWRTKGGALTGQTNSMFTEVVYEIGIKELIKRGFLSPLISKSSLIQANMTGVKITAGEFNLKQAEVAIDREELTQKALDEIDRLATGRKKFLIFAAGVKHSVHIAEALRKRGKVANVITCETPRDVREKILNNFKNSPYEEYLVNNAVLTTGVDLPNIDCIILLRATMSSVLFIQMLGRGMRLHPGKKNCLVLDFAGNIDRFGAVDLIGRPKQKGSKDKDDGKPSIPPQRICPECREPVLIMLTRCPSCDFLFPDEEKLNHSHVATISAVMSEEIKPERFDVISIKYKSAVDKNNNTYVRISYLDNWGIIANEFLHFAYKKTPLLAWYATRKQSETNAPCPNNAQEFLERQDEYKIPKAIWCKKSGKYMEITDYEF